MSRLESLFCGYGVASHFFVDKPLYATVPLVLAVAIALVLAAGRWWWFAILASGAALYAVVHFDPLWLVYVPPVLLNFLFGICFLSTLRRGHRDLISRFVYLVHGEVPAPIAPYARRLTVVWGCYLIALALTALLLAYFAPHEWWSIFANVLSYFLLVGFFVVEYLFRRWRYPAWVHASPLDVARAIRQHGLVRLAQGAE